MKCIDINLGRAEEGRRSPSIGMLACHPSHRKALEFIFVAE